MTRRPIIGITPDINDNTAPETEYVVRKNYADAVLRAGGGPLSYHSVQIPMLTSRPSMVSS